VGLPLLAVGFVDQLTKLIAQRVLVDHPIVLIPGVLDFRLVPNASAIFGLLRTPFQIGIAIFCAAVALGYTFFHGLAEKRLAAFVGLGLIMGGAFGNIVDRVRLGSVVDFVDIVFWSVFNVADVAIVAGIALLLWEAYRSSPAQAERTRESLIKKF